MYSKQEDIKGDPNSSAEKLIVYVDMDHTLCDFQSSYDQLKQDDLEVEYPQSLPEFYLNLEPLDGAIDTYKWLDNYSNLDVFILTAPSILNPRCYTEKRLWVEKWLGMEVVEKLIITSRKDLNRGDYLIDDKLKGKGQDRFQGELIHFGSQKFPSWEAVQKHFEQLL